MSDKVLLEVKELKKDFGGHQVLRGISAQITQGEVVAIIGPSGCGKSTFLRSLNLLEENTPQEFFANPRNQRLREFLSKVL